jgi:rhodanese-related sulfurtransferase
MNTITPLELEALIDNGKPVEIIDVRPRKDFKQVHALGARSVPLAEFDAPTVLKNRKLGKDAPFYVMCRKRALAELAAESLQAAGLAEPIIVEGGIEEWERHGLPVVCKEGPRVYATDGARMALLLALFIGLGIAVHEIFFLVALVIAIGDLISPLARLASDHRFVSHLVHRGHA